MIGLVGVPHGDLPTDELFFANKGIRGGIAPVARLPAAPAGPGLAPGDRPGQGVRPDPAAGQVAEAYAAMDERRAIKVLLQP